MARLALPEVRRSQVGDVPVFSAEAPPPHEVQLWPLLWKHGEKAVELVDELAPPDIVVDMGDDPSPPLFPA